MVQCASTCSPNNAPFGDNPYGLYVLATPAGPLTRLSACTNASGRTPFGHRFAQWFGLTNSVIRRICAIDVFGPDA